MKFFIVFIMLFLFSSCNNDSPQSENSENLNQTKNDSPKHPDSSYEYNVSCKCQGFGEEPFNGSSTNSEAEARLTAGAICVALQPEKEILLKDKDNMSEAEKQRITTIMEQTLQKILKGEVDDSVLNMISDCKTQ